MLDCLPNRSPPSNEEGCWQAIYTRDLLEAAWRSITVSSRERASAAAVSSSRHAATRSQGVRAGSAISAAVLRITA